jgi:hypothetical protein
MGATTQWLFKGTVIYMRFYDEVSLADIADSGAEAMSLFNELPKMGQVNLIVDGNAVQHYPRNLKVLRNAINAALFARVNWFILVSDDYFQHHIAEIFARLFQVRFHVSPNLRDAYRFLQDRMSVPPPQDWPREVSDTMPTR